MEIPINKRVAFSGYRTDKIRTSAPEDPNIIRKIEESISRTISSLYEQGFRDFISGGSAGFDLMVAEVLMKLRPTLPELKITIAVPFVGQEASYDSHSKQLYLRAIRSADHLHYVSDRYHSRAYLDRNKHMLLNSSALVCYYDGQKGGTMYTVNRALRMGHKIINLCESYEIKIPKSQQTQKTLF